MDIFGFFYSFCSIAKLEAAENNIVEFSSKRTIIYGWFGSSIQFCCRPEMCAKTYTRVIINAPLNTNCMGDIKTCRGTVFIIAIYEYFCILFHTFCVYIQTIWYSLYCGCTKLVIRSLVGDYSFVTAPERTQEITGFEKFATSSCSTDITSERYFFIYMLN